ncbi:choice-of-anchor R domain-containing protein [Armatimonas rosea]|uniref:PEP-CTERM protein-sorting domain-containing protein n=1 Tax=Armatimonas rosea TaxID=685828 RepID=A0A7W9SRP7_ARMRO|nr:choice-of-anchor R domain-containing protein [Armatimonas rosea]MBB6051611.1 hypothetical protein [Armatimonas rosea]
MTNLTASLRLCGVLLLSALWLPAHAQVTISNNPATANVQGTVLGNSAGVLADRYWKAYGITTSASGTFDFTSLQIAAENEDGAAHTITGGIYTNSAGNPSSTLVPGGAFGSQLIGASAPPATLLTFTTAGIVTLVPSTTYWFVLTSEAYNAGGTNFQNVVRWDISTGSVLPSATGAGAGDVILEGYRFSENNRTSWTGSILPNGLTIQLAAHATTAAPEPTSVAFLALGGTLVLARRRRA